MRAWRFVAGRRHLVPQDVARPEPGPTDAVVAVRACGLCRTDLHILGNTWPVPSPLTLGHEPAGVVVALGERATGPVAVGSRVAVYGARPCGACPVCREGRPNVCPDRNHLGVDVDGAFADYVLCPASALVEIPAAMSFAAAAATVDSVLTPFHALHNVGRLRAGETVAVFGCGGLGANAVQLAVDLGARVLVVDTDPAKRELALSLGAAAVAARGVQLRTQVDMAADFVGGEDTLADAQTMVRVGGRTVVVGLGALTGRLLALRLGGQETSLLGSYWGTQEELGACLDLVTAGRVTPRVLTSPLHEVNAEIDRLRADGVVGRVVLVPGAEAEPCA